MPPVAARLDGERRRRGDAVAAHRVRVGRGDDDRVADAGGDLEEGGETRGVNAVVVGDQEFHRAARPSGGSGLPVRRGGYGSSTAAATSVPPGWTCSPSQ